MESTNKGRKNFVFCFFGRRLRSNAISSTDSRRHIRGGLIAAFGRFYFAQYKTCSLTSTSQLQFGNIAVVEQAHNVLSLLDTDDAGAILTLFTSFRRRVESASIHY